MLESVLSRLINKQTKKDSLEMVGHENWTESKSKKTKINIERASESLNITTKSEFLEQNLMNWEVAHDFCTILYFPTFLGGNQDDHYGAFLLIKNQFDTSNFRWCSRKKCLRILKYPFIQNILLPATLGWDCRLIGPGSNLLADAQITSYFCYWTHVHDKTGFVQYFGVCGAS